MTSRWPVLLAGCGLGLAALLAYGNSFSGPFVFDDIPAILNNPTIRHLSSMGEVLSPPQRATVNGRPLLNLSFAVNYAAGGTAVWGYHALNLAIHILAGLALFGIVRRTLLLPSLRERFGGAALPLALAVAAIWTLHPLQTESVTYVVQRAESLMGLFYLLTLYACIRGMDTMVPVRWYVLSMAACLLGMATKEVMVSAPLMVFLYDRTFVAGSFSEAWRKRRRLYLGLAATWIPLACLVVHGGGDRSGAFSFGVGSSWVAYWLTQFQAIARYLWLSLWPHPLLFEYGDFWVRQAADILPYAPVVIGLVACTVIGLWRWPVIGFLGVWFFSILAPTSLLPGTSQMIVEHRMYLALAAVVAFAVPGGYVLAGRRRAMILVFLALAAGLGAATWRRNADYQSQLSLWSDTVAKRPENPRARDSLGNALLDAGREKEAIQEYTEALRLAPHKPQEHYNLGRALAATGHAAEAEGEYREALKLDPDYAEAHNNFGVLLAGLGRMEEAVGQYGMALRLQPDNAEAHYNLGRAYAQMDRLPAAIDEYNKALQLDPDSVETHDNLGSAFAQLGRLPEAISQYGEALRLNPHYAGAHNNLGAALMQAGRAAEALDQYRRALQLNPEYADAHRNLGDAFLQIGRMAEAGAEYESALRLKPDDAVVHAHLAVVLFQAGNTGEAMNHCQRALEISPDYAVAHYWLGNILAQTGQIPRAIDEYQEAVRLAPGYAEAHNNLGMLLMQAGRLNEAIAHFDQALRIEPDYAKAAANLAEARAALAARNGRD